MSDYTTNKVEYEHKDTDNSDSVYYINGLTKRTAMALSRAGISTVSALKKTTDFHLGRVRNIGAKSIAEINAAVPERIRAYEGEMEDIKAKQKTRKIDRDVRRILRFMENHNMKLSELIKSTYSISRKREARRLLTEYCTIFPERISDVIDCFEAVNDTADILYIRIKQAHGGKSTV